MFNPGFDAEVAENFLNGICYKCCMYVYILGTIHAQGGETEGNFGAM